MTARRFEVTAAWILGVALPVLETARRRTNFHPLPNYVDDFIAGGLLLIAARAAARGTRHAPALLVAAWGVLCGGIYFSFFGQVAATGDDISGLPNGVVVAIKGAVFVVALIALGLSIRAAAARPA
jgi:hypothetical protein